MHGHTGTMLEKCRERLPAATLLQVDLTKPLPEQLRIGFDRIVSSYVLHEFPLDAKISLLAALADDCLAPGGVIVIGDISFPTAQEREAARERWHAVWDDEEYYWAADEAIQSLQARGWAVEYEQVSVCAGVYTIRPRLRRLSRLTGDVCLRRSAIDAALDGRHSGRACRP